MGVPAFANFAALTVLTVLTSVVYTPASIIADAAVMAASTHVRLAVSATCLPCAAAWVDRAALSVGGHADLPCASPTLQPGDYGRLRTWASVSWTACAPLAGWVNATWGIR